MNRKEKFDKHLVVKLNYPDTRLLVLSSNQLKTAGTGHHYQSSF
jgi:hypothetical protein